jgi:hypothetical protein
MNFIVKVDHLSDEQLAFYGWVRIDEGAEFSLYWSPRYNETQPVSNDPPRFLVVDDWNDAQYMGLDHDVITGPAPRPRTIEN